MTKAYKQILCNIARHDFPLDELQRAAPPVYWVVYDTLNRCVLGRYKTEIEAYAANESFMAKRGGDPITYLIIADPLRGIMEGARRSMNTEVNRAVTAARLRGYDISIFDMYPLEVPDYDL